MRKSKTRGKAWAADVTWPLNACERERGIIINSVVLDETKWGPCIALHGVKRIPIITLAKWSSQISTHFRKLGVETAKFGPAERAITEMVVQLEQATGAPVHLLRAFSRSADGAIDGFDAHFLVRPDPDPTGDAAGCERRGRVAGLYPAHVSRKTPPILVRCPTRRSRQIRRGSIHYGKE